MFAHLIYIILYLILETQVFRLFPRTIGSELMMTASALDKRVIILLNYCKKGKQQLLISFFKMLNFIHNIDVYLLSGAYLKIYIIVNGLSTRRHHANTAYTIHIYAFNDVD